MAWRSMEMQERSEAEMDAECRFGGNASELGNARFWARWAQCKRPRRCCRHRVQRRYDTNERKQELAVHPYSMLIRFGFAAMVTPDLRFVQSTVPPRLRLPITGRFDTRRASLEGYWDRKWILTVDLQTPVKVTHHDECPDTGHQQEE